MQPQQSFWLRSRKAIYEIIEVGRGDHYHSRLFDGFLVVLILANVAAFCAETVPEIDLAYGPWLANFERLSVSIFTVEYLLRVWTAVEVPFLARMSPLRARWIYMTRPLQIVDLLAILPFYLGTFAGLDLRVLRAFRLLRLLKLTRYSPAVHTLARVLWNERRALTGASLLLLTVLLIASSGMYFIEGAVQPDKLGSVPLAAYWAMTTLTTVGYGDVAPVTALGKLWAMLTMVCGLCVLALPVAIVSTGFAQEVGRRDFVVTWAMMSRVPLFADLDASQVTELLPLMHALHVPPNVELISPGSPGTAMYFIASGHVRQYDESGVRDHRTGDYFGVVAFLEGSPNTSRAVTVTRCRLLKLYREDFHRLEAMNPAIGRQIRSTAERRRAERETCGASHPMQRSLEREPED
jgi:voltage-gated potassium channel